MGGFLQLVGRDRVGNSNCNLIFAKRTEALFACVLVFYLKLMPIRASNRDPHDPTPHQTRWLMNQATACRATTACYNDFGAATQASSNSPRVFSMRRGDVRPEKSQTFPQATPGALFALLPYRQRLRTISWHKQSASSDARRGNFTSALRKGGLPDVAGSLAKLGRCQPWRMTPSRLLNQLYCRRLLDLVNHSLVRLYGQL